MQRDPRNFTGNEFAHAYEVARFARDTHLGGHYTYGVPTSPAFDVTLAGTNPQFPSSLAGFELQPSENCPRNFVVFDQTEDRSRVMFHPNLVHKFISDNNNVYPSQPEVSRKGSSRANNNQGNNNHDNYSCSFKEDTKDIDALLSSDKEEEEEDEEDDVVSTGRTPNHWGSSSPDSSSSTKVLKSSMSSFSSARNLTTNGSISNQKNKERMREMVRVLREIIPGGKQLDTPAVLDEALSYLKYLKMEVKKLGIQSFDD